jgi:hypothetical protein
MSALEQIKTGPIDKQTLMDLYATFDRERKYQVEDANIQGTKDHLNIGGITILWNNKET